MTLLSRIILKRIPHQLKLCNYSTNMENKIDIKGQTMNYLKVGTGSHNILCMPGALGTIWSDFKPQIENLDKNAFTVVAWDPPGYGKSRPPNRKNTPDFYENDAHMAVAFMNEIGIKKYSILGWSDGGITGMIMAAKNPDTIQKLVVWGANSYVIPKEIEAYENIRDLSKWSPKMKGPLIEMYTEQGLQEMWNDWCDALQSIHKHRDGDICKKLVPTIQCPTFILHGDKDPLVAAEHVDYLKKNIKESKVYRFADGKHNIHLRYANEFNALVTQFLLLENA